MRAVRPGDRVFVHGAAAAPVALIEALAGRADELEGVRVVHLHTEAPAPYVAPGLARSFRHEAIFVGAMRVGRDHIASTVYTLVLAYAGSALPLLLLFSVANRSLGDVLTSESVAIEISRSAVGGIALALSVPLTTGIAAVLATPVSAAAPAIRADTRRSPT